MGGTAAGIGTIAATLADGLGRRRYSFEPILIGASLIPLVGMAAVLLLVRNNRSHEARDRERNLRHMTIKKFPILFGLFLLITGIPSAAKFYTDWLWFKELGYEAVFLRSLSAQTLVGAVAGVAVFALLAGNLVLALRALRPRPFIINTQHGPQTIMMNPASVRPLAMGAVGIVSLLVANYAGSQLLRGRSTPAIRAIRLPLTLGAACGADCRR